MATIYGESEDIGSASIAPEVKKTVIFEPVFPEYGSGNSQFSCADALRKKHNREIKTI